MINLNKTAMFVGPKASMTINEAGGLAYKLSAKEALAQLASTGCLSQTFYANEVDQLKTVLELASSSDVDDEYLAKLALYAREKGFMKDMPAILCAVLASRKSPWLEKTFPTVIDNGKMLRNFVMAVRSGVTGRKSFGSSVRRLIRNWFDARTEQQIFNNSIGNDPSMADVIKMVHPEPKTPQREAMYGYLIGKTYEESMLPEAVVEYIHLVEKAKSALLKKQQEEALRKQQEEALRKQREEELRKQKEEERQKQLELRKLQRKLRKKQQKALRKRQELLNKKLSEGLLEYLARKCGDESKLPKAIVEYVHLLKKEKDEIVIEDIKEISDALSSVEKALEKKASEKKAKEGNNTEEIHIEDILEDLF